MRIIGGELSGRRFHPPAKKWPTRPTTDIAKEGLYNILQNRIDFETAVFLDLFGGTGNHCYEFISRGCKNVTYVDRYRPAGKFVEKTAEEFGIEEYITIRIMDVFTFIRQNEGRFSVIFAGPPYPLSRIPQLPDLIMESDLLREEGLLILEHNPHHQFSGNPYFDEVRNYGETHFSFFSKNA